MARIPSSLKLTNFDPLLQDLRVGLGGNYKLYHESVVAITHAVGRGKDVSAWFDQMARVAAGVEAATFSHKGVVFLLGELLKGEGETTTSSREHFSKPSAPSRMEMPPPPLPRSTRPAMMAQQQQHAVISPQATQAPFVLPPKPQPPKPQPPALSLRRAISDASITCVKVEQMVPAPRSCLKDPATDPIFFIDTRLKFEVNNFWGNPPGSNDLDFIKSVAGGFNINASYNTPFDFIPRYKPAENDLKIFRKQEGRAAEEKEVQDETKN
ncbi:hypothetical protein ACEQ8H_007069 [Pleosporales sp. CAS-2024a]